MKSLSLKIDSRSVEINIPEKNIIGILKPRITPSLFDVNSAIIRSLINPISCLPLAEMVREKEKIVILASDITRPVPTRLILRPLLEHLVDIGIYKDKIEIIFGLGTHRKHSEEEKELLVGKYVYDNFNCIDHDIDDCVFAGLTSRGTPVEVNNRLVSSDFIIATGNIEYHYMAGYSGGGKALFPGVCSKASIESNHSLMLHPNCKSGNLVDNPMRRDIEEASKIVGLDFIVNVVVDENKQILGVFSGDPIQAHKEGAKFVDYMYKSNIKEKADIVIASCGGFPKDINLYQAQKGLENASYAVKKGGSIVFIASCKEEFGNKVFEEWMTKAENIQEPIDMINERFVLGGHKAAAICKIIENSDIFMYSDMDYKLIESIFMKPIVSIEETINNLIDKYGEHSKILLMPYSSLTLPCMNEEA